MASERNPGESTPAPADPSQPAPQGPRPEPVLPVEAPPPIQEPKPDFGLQDIDVQQQPPALGDFGQQWAQKGSIEGPAETREG